MHFVTYQFQFLWYNSRCDLGEQAVYGPHSLVDQNLFSS